MLETFYNNFGFLGSITVAFLIFIAFIFWMAGIAGISQMKKSKSKTLKLISSILFPPYPIIWVFVDMYRQSQLMKEKEIK
ncbi:hypothetical protein [Fodinibius sp. Rm-B-1B1-1]|uniref:hypothetical protein n=1 Tax=Fodinibius alkaliphilus TaxID=3140241 RepID=UPI00315A710E